MGRENGYRGGLGAPREVLRDRKKAPVLQEELGRWRKSARLTFNTWKAEFCFPEGSLSLWESEGEGAGERVVYQACDRQAGSWSRGLPVTSTLDARLWSQVTGSHVHPWMPVGVTQGAHHTSASQASSLWVQGVSPADLKGPRMCILNKDPGGPGAAGWELAFERDSDKSSKNGSFQGFVFSRICPAPWRDRL